MNAITTTEPVSAQTLEHVLGTGDLSKLSTEQRVEYYVRTCQSLGLNPLTRPFRFLSLNGQTQLYATKDATDQLRSVRGITLHIVDKQIDSDLYVVTARARSKDGREDEDIGAVMLPRSGESRANALMKGTTKAKRRVTLSICGLGGMVDESELDTMPGAMTFDADEEPPVAPIRDAREQMNREVPLKPAAAATPRGKRKVDPNVYETGAETDEQKWLRNLETKLSLAQSRAEVVAVGGLKSVKDAVQSGPPEVQRRVSELLADAYERLPEEEFTDEELGEVEIEGERNVMAGD